MACLDRVELWEGLIGFCLELEKGEIEAKVGRSDADPSGRVSSFPDPGGAPALKRPKTGSPKRMAGGDARLTWDPKTMTRAVSRDLGLIS